MSKKSNEVEAAANTAAADVAVTEESAGAKAMTKESASGKFKKIFIRKPADERGVKAKIVGINGKMYAVPYDKEVEVPVEVYEVLERSRAAEEKACELVESLGGKITQL